MELLGVDAVGLLLTDPQDRLQLMASTSEAARLVELFQIQADEGPCLECHHAGTPVVVPDIAASTGRWPRFAPTCQLAGFAGVHAIPMRCHQQVIGALNMFQATPGGLPQTSAVIAQALADVATIGVLTQRALHDQCLLIEQLHTALNTRVVIEQGKGVLAERLGIGPEEAFTLLRHHARDRNHRLTDLARAVIDGAEFPTPAPGAPPVGLPRQWARAVEVVSTTTSASPTHLRDSRPSRNRAARRSGRWPWGWMTGPTLWTTAVSCLL